MNLSINRLSLPLVLLTLMFFASCSKEDTAVVTDNSADLSLEQTKQTTQAELAADGVFNLIEMAYAEIEENGGRISSVFSDCVTITVSSENGVTFVTLDFGFGCELQNGNVVSGLIHITYGPVQNGTRTINYSFENFTFNSKGIEGGGTIFRERNNAAGNPQSTVHVNFVVTFPAGLVVTIDGTRVAEWIEGVGTGNWFDNVFSITGNRSAETNTGYYRDGLIIEALRYETSCPYFVSGQVEITRNQIEGVLDFGDGECDNIAILTVDGVEYIIILN